MFRVNKKDCDMLKLYLNESLSNIEEIGNFADSSRSENPDELFCNMAKSIHAIKIGASFLNMLQISMTCHTIEIFIEILQRGEGDIEYKEACGKIINIMIAIKKDFTEILNGLSAEKDLEDEPYLEIQFKCEDEILKYIDNINSWIDLVSSNKIENKPEIMNNIEEELVSINTNSLKCELTQNGISEDLKTQFIAETNEHLDKIENDLLLRLEKNRTDFEILNGIFRAVHSIKGGAGIVISSQGSFSNILPVTKDISSMTHAFESLLSIIRDKRLVIEDEIISMIYEFVDYLKICLNCICDGTYVDIPVQDFVNKINKLIDQCSKEASNQDATDEFRDTAQKTEKFIKNGMQSIRVNEEKIERMMNNIAELTIAKNAFLHFSRKISIEYNVSALLAKEIKAISGTISRITDDLQNTVMSIKMVEIKVVFQKIPRIVRDVSNINGKKINLIIEGETTEIDKTIIEQISDPLIHIIRNAADHGIESPKERENKNKPEEGTVFLRAYNQNKFVYIEIQDDGKGMNHEELREKAVERGFIDRDKADQLSENQLLNLIFLPGFSTAQKVSEVSGRGVGMDIVKSNITKLGGTVHIESTVNVGTKFIIKLPLTLSVSRGLLVESEGEEYILPIENIIETAKVEYADLHWYNNKTFVHMRGEMLGVEWMGKILGVHLSEKCYSDCDEMNSVIVSNGSDKIVIIVDKLKSEQEFVVKMLTDCLASIPFISGSTLLGNGKVVLILNASELIMSVNDGIAN